MFSSIKVKTICMMFAMSLSTVILSIIGIMGINGVSLKAISIIDKRIPLNICSDQARMALLISSGYIDKILLINDSRKIEEVINFKTQFIETSLTFDLFSNTLISGYKNQIISNKEKNSLHLTDERGMGCANVTSVPGKIQNLAKKAENFHKDFVTNGKQTINLQEKILKMDLKIKELELEQIEEKRLEIQEEIWQIISTQKKYITKTNFYKNKVKNELLNIRNNLYEHVMHTKKEIKETRQKALFLFSIISVIIFGASLIIGILYSKSITDPILKLTQATKIVASGDLSATIEVKSQDELGVLGEFFNKMSLDLKKVTVSCDYVDNILMTMTDILIVFSPLGIIKTLNPAIRLLGYEEKDLISKSIDIIYDIKEYKELTATAWFNELIKEGSIKNIETTFLKKDGTTASVSMSAALMKDHENNIQGIVSVSKDITDYKYAVKKLEEINLKLSQSNKELSQFAYVASHDLQEPLRKVMVFGDRLKKVCKDSISEKGLDYLQRMQNATNRMQMLIRDLLAYSRVTTVEISYTKVNITELIKKVISDLEINIERSNGVIKCNDLPTIDAIETQLGRLFLNLINNALKFKNKNRTPEIKICCESIDKNANLCNISVKDNGIGFKPEYAENIFGLFKRLHGRSEYEGTGIGLAVCRKIVERHGGTIRAEAMIGEGATFFITLPINH